MSFSSDEPVDLVEELKLRRWAREHYVAAVVRDSAWHPLILDEMQRKEAELSREVLLPSRDPFAAVPFTTVPLPPEPRPVHLFRVLHGAHDELHEATDLPHDEHTASGAAFDPAAGMQFIVSSVAVSPARRGVR